MSRVCVPWDAHTLTWLSPQPQDFVLLVTPGADLMPQEKTPAWAPLLRGRAGQKLPPLQTALPGAHLPTVCWPWLASSHLHTSGCPRPTTLLLHGKRQMPTRLRTGGQPRGPWGHTAVGRDASRCLSEAWGIRREGKKSRSRKKRKRESGQRDKERWRWGAVEKMRKMMQEVRACQTSRPGPRPLAAQAPPGFAAQRRAEGRGH